MNDVAISVRNVAKRYEVFDTQRARLLHAFWPGYRDGMQEIRALEDITFEVGRGESIGVIGRNGSGKSTLLQILTGTLTPSAGEVAVRGRVSALLELGSGFNPDYTGRDNVILNGLLLGLTREEILGRFDEIAAFAEIGAALDRPVKTYSSGMVMRLAFAVQVLTDPEILVIDEALSVGDFFFQQKCFGHIRGLVEKGVTLLFVSHDMGTVRDLCERALYLKQGRLEFAGAAQAAIRHFLAESHVADDTVRETTDMVALDPQEVEGFLADCIWTAPPPSPATSQDARLIGVAFYDEAGNLASTFRIGESINIRVAFHPGASSPPHVTVTLRNKLDQVVTSSGSSRLRITPPQADPEAVVAFDMSLDLMVEAGNYSIAVTLAHLTLPNRGSLLDSSPPLGPIAVQWDYEKDEASFLGMVGLPARGAFKLLTSQSSSRNLASAIEPEK